MPKTLDEAIRLGWFIILGVIILKLVYTWLKYKEKGYVGPGVDSEKENEEGGDKTPKYIPPFPLSEEGTLGVMGYPFQNLLGDGDDNR